MYSMTDEIRRRFAAHATIGAESECWPWSGTFRKTTPIIWTDTHPSGSVSAISVSRAVAGLPDAPRGGNVRSCGNFACVNPHHCGAGTEMLRFWGKVDKAGACWEWTGTKSPNGYGTFKIRNTDPLYAHRISYEAIVGPIPDGLHIDHLCRNRGCVNPAHMEPVTSKVNNLRGESIAAKNARKTHCHRGHEFTPENTWLRVGKRGPCRECRTCARAAKRAASLHRNRCSAAK